MNEIVNTLMSGQVLAMILAAVCVFATIITFVTPMLSREEMNKRMRQMATERDKLRSQRMTEMSTREAQRSGKLRNATPQGFMKKLVDTFDLKSQFDNEELRNKLKMAGLRGQGPIVSFLFFRVIAPPASFLVTLFYVFVVANIDYSNSSKFMMAVAAGGLGFYLPNIFIENLAQKRQQSVKQAFPDALDMLLICVQSGMSVESSFGRVAKEIAVQSVELAEELSLTTAELSYLGERRLAFENLGKRTGLPGVKAACTAMIQAERYGTPVGQALRVMAKENRDMRMGEAEKKAAALPPKLTVPMILFFLPVLFVVILGPAAISYYKWQ